MKFFIMLLMLMMLVYVYGTDCASNQVNCEVCSDPAYTSNNIIGLPRVKSDFTPISSDLGDYSWYETVDDPKNPGTTKEQFINPNNQLDALVQYKLDPNSPFNYLESVLLYPIVMLIFGILMVVFGILLVLFRYCSCLFCMCCCFEGTCGKRYPTEKKSAYWCGFTVDEANSTVAYSKKEVWGARIFMLLFCFFMVLWIGVGQVNGNQMVDDSAKAFVRSPSNLVSFVQTISTPLESFSLNIIGDSFINAITKTDQLLYDTMNYTKVSDGLVCFIDKTQQLPTLDFFINWILDTDDINNNISVTLDLIPPVLDTLMVPLQNELVHIYDSVIIQGDNLNSVELSLNESIAIINNATISLNYITSNITGTGKIESDLLQMRNNWPSVPQATLVTNTLGVVAAPTPSLQQKIDAITALTDYNTQLLLLPNLTETAVIMQNLDIELGNVDIYAKLSQSINNTELALSVLNSSITDLQNMFYNLSNIVSTQINLNEVKDILTIVNASMYDISFDTFTEQINTFYGLSELLPCLDSIAEQFYNINDTLFVIPSEFDQMSGILDILNNTLVPIFNMADELNANIDVFKQSRSDINVTGLLSDIDKTNIELQNEALALIDSNFINNLTSLQDSFANINYTIIDSLNNLTNFLATRSSFNQTTLDEMVASQSAKESLITEITYASSDITLYKGGFCDTNFIYCEVNTDCANVCDLTNTPRCNNNLNVACTSDADCATGNGRCMVDNTRYTIIQVGTNLISYNPIVGLNVAIFDVNDIQHEATLADPSEFKNGLLDSYNIIQNIDINSILIDLNATINNQYTFDINGTMSSFSSIQDALASTNLTSMVDMINNMNTSYSEIDIALQAIDDMINFFDLLEEFHFTKWPNDVYQHLQLSELTRIQSETNYTNTMLHVLTVLDDMFLWLNDNQVYYNVSTDFVDQFHQYVQPIDAITTNMYSKYGPFHFFFAMSSPACSNFSSPDCGIANPESTEYSVYRMNTDSNGNKYPNSKVCYTNYCFDNEINFYNNEPLNQIPAFDNVFGVDYIAIGREDLIALPYIIPGFLAFLSLLSLVPLGIGKYFNCTSVFFIILFSPFIFIFSGFFFMFPILLGDLCYGGANVGLQVIQHETSGICNSLNGTFDSISGDCYGVPVLSYENATVDFNTEDLYGSILGTNCGGKYGDPTNVFFNSLEANVGQIPIGYMNAFLTDHSVDSVNQTLQIQQPLANLIMNVTENSVGYFATLVSDASIVFGCKPLHSVYQGFKDAFCCDFLTAIYWSFGSWCLIAWSMCICGVPSNLLLRKRNSPTLWGPEYNAALQRINDDMAFDDFDHHDTIELDDLEFDEYDKQ